MSLTRLFFYTFLSVISNQKYRPEKRSVSKKMQKLRKGHFTWKYGPQKEQKSYKTHHPRQRRRVDDAPRWTLDWTNRASSFVSRSLSQPLTAPPDVCAGAHRSAQYNSALLPLWILKCAQIFKKKTSSHFTENKLHFNLTNTDSWTMIETIIATWCKNTRNVY